MTESIGTLVPTEIPTLSENANIQEAFRIYHYGAPNGVGIGEYDITNNDPHNLVEPSIAFSLNYLNDQIIALSGTLGIQNSMFTTKGDILSATGPSAVVRFGVGSNGKVLTANSATATGLEWAVPTVTPTNTVTLTNKTLTAPIVTQLYLEDSIVVFEGATADGFETTLTVVDPTADRTASLPDRSGTLQMDTIEINPQTDSYTLVLADRSKLVEVNSADPENVTIPLNATVAYPIGATVMVGQTGAGQVSIVVTAGVTLNGTPQGTTNVIKLRDRWSVVVLIKRDTNTWLAVGDITT